MSNEEIVSKSGIKSRRYAKLNENTNSMAIEAVTLGIQELPYAIDEIDLIVGATYTPHDTVATRITSYNVCYTKLLRIHKL